jgi:hypothetical protein
MSRSIVDAAAWTTGEDRARAILAAASSNVSCGRKTSSPWPSAAYGSGAAR